MKFAAPALVLLLLLAGCGRKAQVKVPRLGSVESGVASWYGHPYHGRAAANGEIYDMEKLTAAHRTLPFDTWVRVRNLDNDRRVDVRITDRGPFIRGRIIDLSLAAARSIDMVGPGTAKVKVQILSVPDRLSRASSFAVQVGAFQDRENAERLRASLSDRFSQARLVRREGKALTWRVLVGREPSEERAQALCQRLQPEFTAAFVVRADQ